jgi:hypothetical protein
MTDKETIIRPRKDAIFEAENGYYAKRSIWRSKMTSAIFYGIFLLLLLLVIPIFLLYTTIMFKQCFFVLILPIFLMFVIALAIMAFYSELAGNTLLIFEEGVFFGVVPPKYFIRKRIPLTGWDEIKSIDLFKSNKLIAESNNIQEWSYQHKRDTFQILLRGSKKPELIETNNQVREILSILSTKVPGAFTEDAWKYLGIKPISSEKKAKKKSGAKDGKK